METAMLKNFQQRGVDFGMSIDTPGLLMDRGTGKTPTGMRILRNKVAIAVTKRILYVAPLSTLENLRREAAKWTDNIRAQIIYGTRSVRQKMIVNPRQFNMDIINFDGVRIMIQELAAQNYDTIVVDESTKIKDRDTKVSEMIRKILSRRATTRMILTGMPFTEGVEDAWAQFDFLAPGVFSDNYYAFRNRYCVTTEIEVPYWDKVEKKRKWRKIRKITGYKRLDEFENLILPYVYRVDKKEALPELPPLTFQTVEIDMTEAQRKAYRRVEKTVYSEIEGHQINHAIAITKLGKLRQVAAGFMYDNEHEAAEIPTAKYQELVSNLEESLYGRKKAVVFTSFKAEIPMVVDAISNGRRRLIVFEMPVSATERQPMIDAWSMVDGPAVLVANAISGGTGLNMMAACEAHFISRDWKMEPNAQAQDRIYRYGSEVHSNILILDYVTKGTVEVDVLQSVRNKQDLVDIFLDRLKAKQEGGVV